VGDGGNHWDKNARQLVNKLLPSKHYIGKLFLPYPNQGVKITLQKPHQQYGMIYLWNLFLMVID
jgi:hypothetical protein